MTQNARRHLRLLCLAGTALSCGLTAPAVAQTATALPDVNIHSDEAVPGAPADAVTVTKQDIERHEAQSSDLADILTRLPGVSAYGAGGFSSLPSIRGLDNQRVGILVDGVPIDYACPNNMNPPLSYTDPQTVGSVSVVTGVSPVSLGGDTIGGSILAASTVTLGAFELHSLTAYRELFVLCVIASTLAALLALTIPKERAGAAS